MTDKPKYAVGQWVCVLSGGALIYSVIRYVRELSRYPYGIEYVTDHGAFSESQIVEVR